MSKELLRMQRLAGLITESQCSKLSENQNPQSIKKYLLGLFDGLDLGDEFQEGPQSYTFEEMEWADEDNYGDEALMFPQAHNYIKSKGGSLSLRNKENIPLTFTLENENIVVDFSTDDFSSL